MVISSSQYVETKANNSGRYTTTENVNVSITSCALEHQLQLDISYCSQVDLLYAEAQHPTLLEGQPSGH